MIKRLRIALVLLFFIIAILFVFYKNNYNIDKNGNTTYKINNLKAYILKINSYEAVADITIKSNKLSNKYKVKQKESKSSYFFQEVLEPENIAGSVFSWNGNDLILENSKLNIAKVYKNYKCIYSNQLSLISFINDYNLSQDISFTENETEVFMEVKIQNNNKYIAKKVLKIDKNTGNPISLEIYDNTQNLLVYILYSEIKINGEPEEVIAYLSKDKLLEI